jgi:hypothetical protein
MWHSSSSVLWQIVAGIERDENVTRSRAIAAIHHHDDAMSRLQWSLFSWFEFKGLTTPTANSFVVDK